MFTFLQKSLLVILFLSQVLLFAQESSSEREINQQIWIPFSETYASFDAEGFMALHTEDVVRVSRDGKKMYIGAEYGERMQESFARMKSSGTTRTIEFRFLQRLSHKDAAYEVGYYKLVTTRPGGQPKTYYGQFHVTLRKINGVWKIATDSDSSLNNSITEEDFQNGSPL